MEKSPQLHNNSIEQKKEEPKSVESSSNFEGNYSLLLFKRVRNPFIQEQLINLLCEEELDHQQCGDESVVFDENGNIISISPTEVKMEHRDYVARTKKEILDDFYKRLNAVETDTPITYDSKVYPHTNEREIMPIVSDNYMAMMGAADANLEKQIVIKSAIEAHEKGHILRPFAYNRFFENYFRKGFDIPSIDSLTVKDFPPMEVKQLPEEKTEDYTKRQIEDHIKYLFNGAEIAERMSQLKGYFGFTGSEQFTKEHLDYAKAHYVSDTNLNNSMTVFLKAITPETETDFLRIINTSGI